MIDIDDIQKKTGIRMKPSTLKLHSEQGLVNEVYTVESEEGKLIIHIGKYSDPKEQLQKAKRVYELSQFLEKHPQIPITEFIGYGKESQGRVYTVQRFVNGKELHKIKSKITHLRKLGIILARLHQIDIQGGGHITFKTGQIKGKHKDWFKFLKKEAYKALRETHTANKKRIPTRRFKEAKTKLGKFFSKYKDIFTGVKAKLMHGDIMLGNVLVDKENITALIDLEWSCAGDPAWEFAGHKHLQDVVLNSYLKEAEKLGNKIDRDNFELRIKLYSIIKLLFVGHTFKNVDRFDYTMDTFEKGIAEVI